MGEEEQLVAARKFSRWLEDPDGTDLESFLQEGETLE